MPWIHGGFVPILIGCALSLTVGCHKKESPNQAPAEVRIGYFGNLTHAQAVLGVYSGDFASAVAPSKLTTHVFNAGPSLIEALLAGEIDVGYVGPGPALNANLKSKGEGIRVLCGAAANGVLIVARKDSGINTLADLKGKIVATPQHGNTQDIAARYFLKHGLNQENLDNVRPIPNTEQAGLMDRGQIDASWAPEPWGSRLVAEIGAHVVAEEKDIKELWPNGQFVLTLVITTPEFLSNHSDLVKKLLTVHHAWTVRLQTDPDKYIPQLEEALFAVNGKKLPARVLNSSIKRVHFLDDPLPESIHTMADWAYKLEFAPRPAELGNLIDTRIIDAVKGEPSAH